MYFSCGPVYFADRVHGNFGDVSGAGTQERFNRTGTGGSFLSFGKRSSALFACRRVEPDGGDGGRRGVSGKNRAYGTDAELSDASRGGDFRSAHPAPDGGGRFVFRGAAPWRRFFSAETGAVICGSGGSRCAICRREVRRSSADWRNRGSAPFFRKSGAARNVASGKKRSRTQGKRIFEGYDFQYFASAENTARSARYVYGNSGRRA